MNILFLTLANICTLAEKGIYHDLMREFAKNGHQVYIATPIERRYRKNTELIEENNCRILRIKTGNIQKTNLIEKGISTLRLEPQFKKAIKKYFNDVKFDLVIYTTPPITFAKVVGYIKKRDGAQSLLLLKDIFPQNAVDLGILSKKGLKGIIYKFFRKKERRLYELSDNIGCMSQANLDYVLEHNPTVKREKLFISPNSIEPKYIEASPEEKKALREKYDIPADKKVLVYGGNLGKPQSVPFIIECLKSQKDNDGVFFLIVGDGTDYHLFEDFVKKDNPENVKVLKRLAKEDFDTLVASCDVGMIFLDHRFTIPNYPSRLLSYMQAGIPVLACTDPNTDVGKDIVENGFGWWCESNDVDAFDNTLTKIADSDLKAMGAKACKHLADYFSVNVCYEEIMRCLHHENS